MRRAAFLFLATLSAAASLSAAEVLTAEEAAKKNPFKPVNAPGGPAPTAHESIEFAGVSQMGSTTTLIFLDKSVKKNRWIGIGETVEGISVLHYDPRVELATVKINGAEKTLALRKGTGPANAPALAAPPPPAASFATPLPANQAAVAQPAPPPTIEPAAPAQPADGQAAPPKPAPAPGTPEAQVKAETDARMLVSDLLEIGMAQRKAYEEAQRKAAEGKSGQPTPPPAEPAK